MTPNPRIDPTDRRHRENRAVRFLVRAMLAGAGVLLLILLYRQTVSPPDREPREGSVPVPGERVPTAEKVRPAGGAPRLVPIPWQRPPRVEVAPEQLGEAIRAATGYLVRVCDSDGRFVYELDLESGKAIGGRYNLLRHAGTMHALATAYRRKPDPEVLGALQRSAEFLRREAIAAVPDAPEMSAVWSDPRVTGGSGPRFAKLGGAGLALVALTQLEQLAPGTVPREELRRLGRFLQFMQKPDGSFYSKYFPDRGRDDSWTSLYYPGEACLGAILLYELDGRDEWLEIADRGLAYLARPEVFHEPPLPDHWMLLALERLLPHCDERQLAHPRAVLLEHARRTCQGMIAEQEPCRGDPRLDGCFGDDGRTAPTATRLEGLLAARRILPAGDPLRKSLDESIQAGIQFLLRCQVVRGPHRGAIPMAAGPLPLFDRRSSRFNPRVGHVRIDYVQHALCAFIDYERDGDGAAD